MRGGNVYIRPSVHQRPDGVKTIDFGSQCERRRTCEAEVVGGECRLLLTQAEILISAMRKQRLDDCGCTDFQNGVHAAIRFSTHCTMQSSKAICIHGVGIGASLE